MTLKDKAYFHFALAQGCEAIGEFDEAFENLDKGNLIKNEQSKYSIERMDNELQAQIDVCDKNFFSNLGEIGTITNDLLQLKFAQAGKDTMRFLLNSTLGVFGVFDVATPMGLSKNKEDFGQTLGFWGVPDGPYLVLPFLGPSSVRDGPSMMLDYEISPVEQLHHEERQVLQTLDIIDTRARLLRATKILDTAAKDKYIFIRESYLQKRESLVNDGNVKEEFEIDVHSVDY